MAESREARPLMACAIMADVKLRRVVTASKSLRKETCESLEVSVQVFHRPWEYLSHQGSLPRH